MIARETIDKIEILVGAKNEQLFQLRNILIESQVSNYPIFILTNSDSLPLGKRIFDKYVHKVDWHIHISHLEELFHKKVVSEDKIEHFRLQYKDKSDMYCILCADEKEMGFIYVPILF